MQAPYSTVDPRNILVAGLDNSGKSTLIDSLKPQRQHHADIAPTVGFNLEEFQYGPFKFQAFDMAGAGRYRSLWEKYLPDAHVIMYVIDSADHLRLIVAKDELEGLLSHPHRNKDSILLVCANKMDIPGAMAPDELADLLRLQLSHNSWQIFSTNALTGEGVRHAMEWLAVKLQAPR